MKLYKETKIGLIIALVIAAFIWGLNFLKGRNLFTTHQQYYAVFENIGGLEKSSVVFTHGYRIGKVSDISFFAGNVNKILVEISVDRKFKIPKNSLVEIYSSDILGTKAINLMLGNSREMSTQNDTLPSRMAEDMTSIISKQVIPLKNKAENLIESLDSVTEIIRHTLNPRTQRNIQNSVAALESLIVDEKTKIDNILSNLESISQNFKNSNKSFSKIASNFSSLSDSIASSNIKQAISQANMALSQTNQLLTKINSGTGTMGQLMNNESLYLSLHKSVLDLDSLLVDLKGHPKRYVQFSVFGKKDSKSK
jgi:phospholipid/cholesterol/gamma-HCH transport system substrate-binding protein